VHCVGSGAGGALTCGNDRDIDAIMPTATAVAAGRFHLIMRSPLVLSLSIFSVSSWGLPLVGGSSLLASPSFFTALFIHLLNRTPQNIVIGGAAGAFHHDRLGSVTGDISFYPITLF